MSISFSTDMENFFKFLHFAMLSMFSKFVDTKCAMNNSTYFKMGADAYIKQNIFYRFVTALCTIHVNNSTYFKMWANIYIKQDKLILTLNFLRVERISVTLLSRASIFFSWLSFELCLDRLLTSSSRPVHPSRLISVVIAFPKTLSV